MNFKYEKYSSVYAQQQKGPQGIDAPLIFQVSRYPLSPMKRLKTKENRIKKSKESLNEQNETHKETNKKKFFKENKGYSGKPSDLMMIIK